MRRFLGTVLGLTLAATLVVPAAAAVPFMQRPGTPGVAPVLVALVDYPETHAQVPGQFDAQHYPKYDEVLAIMLKWANDYPNLVSVYSGGESYQGRIIWQMTISNKLAGPATQKPAMYVGGNRHAGEVTARVAALEFAYTLLSNYGKDPEITKLVDSRAFYVRPMENPDGAELYLSSAQTLRSTVRPFDEDDDGFCDEDIAEDLDGDGFIRQVRQYVGPGKGSYTIDPNDPSKRLMVSVGAGKGDYIVQSEGVDNDKDGRINEDGIGGLDLHRNYPENWRPMEEETGFGYTQGNAGEYPLSEPEMRSLVLWLLKNPNVAIGQTMDTSVPMLLRPPSTSKSEESMFPSDLAYYKYFDTEGLKVTGYGNAGDVYWDYANRNRPNATSGSPLFGHSPDWGYFQYGVIWYGDELWGIGNYMKDFNGDGKIDNYDRLWLNDNVAEIKGKLYQNWTPVTHPTLGAVEVGGWNPKFWNQNPPAGSILQEYADKETRFNLLLAKSLPLLVLKSATATKNADGTATISVTVANEGFLPDALQQAWLVKIVRRNQASLQLGQGLSLAGGSLAQEIPFFSGALDKDGRSQTITWKVKGSGKADITVRSTRGGLVKASLDI